MQARARRTREKIIGQAKRAFAERGFEATNLTEHILTPAGVSVGSFYHQFSNKREVLLEIFERSITARHAHIRELLRERAPTTCADAYRQVLEALLDDVDADPEVARIQLREYESPDPEITARAMVGVEGWITIFATIIDPWYVTDDPNFARAARVAVLIGFGVFREYIHTDLEDRPGRRDELVTPACTFVVAGLDAMLPRR